jgi:uncharacterized protein involved in high-affinity Fe2+ transport
MPVEAAMKQIFTTLIALSFIAAAGKAVAREWFIGGPVEKNDMEIVANYLKGVEMAPALPGMEGMVQGDMIHLEADIHATADNPYGYADGGWIPYLTIDYTLAKTGADWTRSGKLLPMTAKDGPHYATNVMMDGDGQYRLTYVIAPPADGTFWRHIDKETGVPPWWKPITVSFDFKYPAK